MTHQTLTLKCEQQTESRSFRQGVTLEQGDCGAGFAALFCEYAKLSGKSPTKEQERELAYMLTNILLGPGCRT